MYLSGTGPDMKFFFLMTVVFILTGCGAEVATTAATGAAIKKQEMEEGIKTQERAEKKINEAMELMQQRAKQSDADAR
jgi:hypothetical protein